MPKSGYISILIESVLWLVYFSFNFLGAIDHSQPVLEPYKVEGERIVFTNWYFVRPGHFDWLDENGASVYAAKKSNLGPYDAQFVSYDIPRGINLFVEPAVREIPVIPTDKAWDQRGIVVQTLIHENGKYRMWATCYSDIYTEYNCYFESNDGIHWQKPDLGIIEFNGNKHNNLIDSNVRLSVFIDSSKSADERYKTIWHSRISQTEFEKYKDKRPWSFYATELDAPLVHILKGAVSADGLRWKELPDPLAFEHVDTQNIGYFDERGGSYVLYVRNFMAGSRAPGQDYPKAGFHQHVSRRSIARMESNDFNQFPLSKVIIEPGADMHPSEQFYTNCYTRIPRAPDHHLMFPTIYNVADDGAKVVLFSSYNGINWHKIPGPAIIELPAYGEPDGGWLFARPNLVERPNGDWILPYEGYDVPHKYARGAYRFEPGMLVWPKGRMAGIEAQEEGSFATVYFIMEHTKIKINALTRRAGYIKVELVDMELNPVPGYSFEENDPVIGNQFWTDLSWNGNSDISKLTGQPIMLRFKMDRAKIYGLEFK